MGIRWGNKSLAWRPPLQGHRHLPLATLTLPITLRRVASPTD